ncbi:MAG: BlaI/MecI/CopY family transcriptional regulator [Solirubrobacterales bacterium]
MAERRSEQLGPLESELMELVWRLDRPLSVRELLEQLNRGRDPQLAYTTVMTVASRLAEKGALERRREGRGYIYRAAAPDAAALAVRGVLRDFGEEAVAHFVEEARDDPKALRRLRRLLAEES